MGVQSTNPHARARTRYSLSVFPCAFASSHPSIYECSAGVSAPLLFLSPLAPSWPHVSPAPLDSARLGSVLAPPLSPLLACPPSTPRGHHCASPLPRLLLTPFNAPSSPQRKKERNTHTHTHTHTQRQTDRPTDRPTDRKKEKEEKEERNVIARLRPTPLHSATDIHRIRTGSPSLRLRPHIDAASPNPQLLLLLLPTLIMSRKLDPTGLYRSFFFFFSWSIRHSSAIHPPFIRIRVLRLPT